MESQQVDRMNKKTLDKPQSPTSAVRKDNKTIPPSVINPAQNIIAYDFTEAEEARALKKLSDAAMKWDRSSTSSLSLSAFDPIQLGPAEFKEALRKTFSIQVNPKELGAIMTYFDKNGDGNVNCQRFLVKFTQMGAERRASDRLKKLKQQRNTDSYMEAQKQRKQEEMEMKADFTLVENIEPTEESRKTAMDKIRLAASKYDKNHSSSVSLNGFQVSFLKPVEFREVLKRTFNIHLTKEEILSILPDFDKSNQGVFNCSDFLLVFFKYSNEEHERKRQELLEHQRRTELEQSNRLKKFTEQISSHNTNEVDYNYDESDYMSGIQKVINIANKYDKTLGSAISLQSFETTFMTVTEFYSALKRTFGIQLTARELGALMVKFSYQNQSTLLDCKNFMYNFLQIGIEYRKTLHKQQLLKTKLLEQRKKSFEMKREEEYKKFMVLNIVSDFTEDDFQSAMNKIRDAAFKYDKTAPGASSLAGFSGATMSPGFFNDILRRTFGINFTNKEFSALLNSFKEDNRPSSGGGGGSSKDHRKTGDENDEDDDDLSDDDNNGQRKAIVTTGGGGGEEQDMVIDSKEFIQSFLRLGMEERFRHRQEQLKKEKQYREALKMQEDMKIQSMMSKIDIQVDVVSCTDADRNSALQKLRDSAEKYDRNHPSAPKLESFSGLLTASEFKELLRRVLSIHLTPREAGALFRYFVDTRVSNESAGNSAKTNKSDGKEAKKIPQEVISGEKFTIAYVQMGIDAREQAMIMRKETQRKLEQDAEDERKRKIKIERQKLDIYVDYTNYNQFDHESAFKKILDVSFRYDPTISTNDVLSRAFEPAFLTPLEFRDSLKKVLGLRFTNTEFNAIMTFYDRERRHRIVSQDFMTHFLKLGFDERQRQKAIHLEQQRAKREFEKQSQVRKLRKIEEKIEKGIDYEFTVEDEKSAFDKIIEAAKYFDKSKTSASSLEGFNAAFLKPGVFRDLLRRTLNIQLTGRELGAVVKYFDKEDKKLIPSTEFLSYFYKLSFNEKNKDYLTTLKKNRTVDKLKTRQSDDKMAAEWVKLESEIDWDFSDKDEDAAFLKLSRAARDFDPLDESAKINMKAFEVQRLAPAEFRDKLKRILNVKLSHKQAGALITQFFFENERYVDCSKFQIRFTNLCNLEKEKIRMMSHQKRMVDEEAKKEMVKTKQQELEMRIEDAVDDSFSKEDFNNALNKLEKGISSYDKSNPTSLPLDAAFSAQILTITEFREQLKIIFGIILTPKELGAITKLFGADTNNAIPSNRKDSLGYVDEGGAGASQAVTNKTLVGTGNDNNNNNYYYKPSPSENAEDEGDKKCTHVSTKLFLQHLYKIQRESKTRIRQEKQRRQKEMAEKARRESEARRIAKEKAEWDKLTFDEDDETSLIAKLREVGKLFYIDSSVYVKQLQLVKDQGLPASAFRDTFHRIFGIRLSFPEIGALMSVLDEIGVGTIDVTRFTTAMFRIGRIEQKVETGEINENVLTLSSLMGIGEQKDILNLIESSKNHHRTSTPPPKLKSKPRAMTASNRISPRRATGQPLIHNWLLPKLPGEKYDFKVEDDIFQTNPHGTSSSLYQTQETVNPEVGNINDGNNPFPSSVLSNKFSKTVPIPIKINLSKSLNMSSSVKKDMTSRPSSQTAPIYKSTKLKKISKKNSESEPKNDSDFDDFGQLNMETGDSQNILDDNKETLLLHKDSFGDKEPGKEKDTENAKTQPNRRKKSTGAPKTQKKKPVFFFPALLGTAPIFTVSRYLPVDELNDEDYRYI